MAACGYYAGNEGVASGGLSPSAFSGLEPRKQEALRQLLDELKDELEGAPSAAGRIVRLSGATLLEEAPETPGLRQNSEESGVLGRGLTPGFLRDGTVPLMSLENSLADTPSHADAASLFASSAILRASLWDGSGSSGSSGSGNNISNRNSTCSSPTAEGEASATSPAPIAAAPQATAAAAAELWECLAIPDEGIEVPWPLAFPQVQPCWGPARNPFCAALRP